MLTIVTEINGKVTSTETDRRSSDEWLHYRKIQDLDPFQVLGAPNLASAAELIDPTLALFVDGRYNGTRHSLWMTELGDLWEPSDGLAESNIR